MMRFRENGPARKAVAVRLYHDDPAGKIYWVTGWADQDRPADAFIQPVEDSGSGVAYLLYGGNCGLRFKPYESAAPWSLTDAGQWGEAFLLLGDIRDIIDDVV